tara:strand:- start:834 stop:1172 length:339 start_codon:yes stop_codon:yes gene_type:complete
MSTKQNSSKLSAPQVKQLKGFKFKSTQIRYLASLGLSTGDIVRTMQAHVNPSFIYQHARNVLNTPVKNPVETFKVAKPRAKAKRKAPVTKSEPTTTVDEATGPLDMKDITSN